MTIEANVWITEGAASVFLICTFLTTRLRRDSPLALATPKRNHPKPGEQGPRRAYGKSAGPTTGAAPEERLVKFSATGPHELVLYDFGTPLVDGEAEVMPKSASTCTALCPDRPVGG
ncbi:hypothetical protein FNH05_01995 [Amycolatopsis rhizosphaerae]|uniref:Uncharacterized protein n=1 Tax=Amycolatopsis rhizosphaerae TaxID=2053003 RepID=A0A558DLL4_9PSEU|nr:hypothetical protein [Amycolatopsis rhizosphaerae]TVT61915.1 hypothetical protein FNH05_01995 [Amycolatopsis rhizosphaerae]